MSVYVCGQCHSSPCQCHGGVQAIVCQPSGQCVPSPCEDLWELPNGSSIPAGFRLIKTETSGDIIVAGPCGSSINTPGAIRLTINGVPNSFGGAITNQTVSLSGWQITGPTETLNQNGSATARLLLFAGPSKKVASFICIIPVTGTIDAIAGDGNAILNGFLDIGNPSGSGFSVAGKATGTVVPTAGFGGNTKHDLFTIVVGTITAVTVETIFA